MYYIKKTCQTDFHGLHTIRRPLEARSYTKEFNRKPGKPPFWKNKMISFRDLCKSHNFAAKETHKEFCKTEYLQNVLY